MITNIWASPSPVDAKVISGNGARFTDVTLTIHRDVGNPVIRTIPKGTSNHYMAEILHSMAYELVKE